MTTAMEIVRPRTTSELGAEVRALDAPVACCVLPSCPRPAAEGSNLCSEHGGAEPPREPPPRARPLTERELATWLSGAIATARFWGAHYESESHAHVGTWVFGDISSRAQRYAHIGRMADVLLLVTGLGPCDFEVSRVAEVDFLRRLHAEGPRVAASLPASDVGRRDQDLSNLVGTALGGLRREVRALLGVVA